MVVTTARATVPFSTGWFPLEELGGASLIMPAMVALVAAHLVPERTGGRVRGWSAAAGAGAQFSSDVSEPVTP